MDESRKFNWEDAMDKAELDLCYLTATEAITAFKAKKLSPVDLMKAMVVRCEAVNPKVRSTSERSIRPVTRKRNT
jgi:Asp-tRNA(Asn)/Glu-tRNA(Gln) amidotransferase A subunit family amidase